MIYIITIIVDLNFVDACNYVSFILECKVAFISSVIVKKWELTYECLAEEASFQHWNSKMWGKKTHMLKIFKSTSIQHLTFFLIDKSHSAILLPI